MIRYEILKVVEIFRIVNIEGNETRKWKMKSMGREEEREGKNKGQKGEKEGWEEDDGRRWGGKKMGTLGGKKEWKNKGCRKMQNADCWDIVIAFLEEFGVNQIKMKRRKKARGKRLQDIESEEIGRNRM